MRRRRLVRLGGADVIGAIGVIVGTMRMVKGIWRAVLKIGTTIEVFGAEGGGGAHGLSLVDPDTADPGHPGLHPIGVPATSRRARSAAWARVTRSARRRGFSDVDADKW
jgi:hypothetical protein